MENIDNDIFQKKYTPEDAGQTAKDNMREVERLESHFYRGILRLAEICDQPLKIDSNNGSSRIKVGDLNITALETMAIRSVSGKYKGVRFTFLKPMPQHNILPRLILSTNDEGIKREMKVHLNDIIYSEAPNILEIADPPSTSKEKPAVITADIFEIREVLSNSEPAKEDRFSEF